MVGGRLPPYFVENMDIISFVSEKVNGFIEASSLLLVEVKVKPTNNIKVYIDGDEGVNIDTCIKINRALYNAIEESGMFPEGDFSLEVSSPGVDTPLKMMRQYHKNIGRTVEITLNDDTTQQGKMIAVSDEKVTLEKKLPKNKGTETVELPFDMIKSTVVQIVF